MSKDLLTAPRARTWREIPQPVKPRAMSKEGKWRLTMRVLRITGAAAALGAGTWCAWKVTAVLADNGREAPAAAKAEPIGDHIVLTTDGVLDRAWLVRTLALPRGATLMGVDPAALRERVLANGQVLSASIGRDFPATLTVRISERSPIACVMAKSADGTVKPLLAARDGTVYDGLGYDPLMIQTLPWLDGVKLIRRGGGFAPIEGMSRVADLLGRTKLEANHLYLTWQVVSLAKLQSDGLIGIRTRDGLKVVFGTQEDFFRQLARLDLILDTAAKAQPGRTVGGEIDLSLGAQVPVRLEGRGLAAGEPTPRTTLPSAAKAPPPISAFPHFQIHLN